MGSNTIINVVSVRNTLNLGDLLRKPVIHSKKIDYPAHFYIVLMVAITALSQKFFDPYPRIPERLELFPGLHNQPPTLSSLAFSCVTHFLVTRKWTWYTAGWQEFCFTIDTVLCLKLTPFSVPLLWNFSNNCSLGD